MIIIAEGDTVINSAFVSKIYIGGRNDNTSIRADVSNGIGSELARYSKKELSQYALEMLAIAWAANDPVFRFPSEKDVIARMSLAKSASVHVKTKENRHGGS